ncbi:transmembrane protein 169 [Aplysia californica]|uniref:Transmembrane protein 169 n=1 Tax=Aplysia californica TaxID=6500 RepID=A0ABM0JUA2_APLCA|nr:transmembrane protein 169 [Aplysia californica]
MAEALKEREVELVVLSEQTEPLLVPSQSETANQQNQNGATANTQSANNSLDQGEEEDHVFSNPQGGASNIPSSPTNKGDGPSPSHTFEFLTSGGIPKNRKRPGSTSDSQRVTMTGMVTRGSSVGQPVEVQMELTETEFLRLTSRESHPKPKGTRGCDRYQGVHIILWSVLCMPVAMVISLCMSFYNGAMTWYNLIIYFSEEKSWVHKLTLCPILILSFPLTVGLSSVAISLVAMVMQISWSWRVWWAEFCDGEKGFYGWFCSKIGLPNCSPYEVVVLDDAPL